jgi:hypothetical protein
VFRTALALSICFFILSETVVVRGEDTVSNVYASLRTSVALVIASKDKTVRSTGTAFCVYSDDHRSIFLTNHHVIDGADTVTVLLQEPHQFVGQARILRIGSGGIDAALLEISFANVPALSVTTVIPPEGTRIAVAGYPRTQVEFGVIGLGLTPSLHVGTVNALPGYGTFIQFDAQIEPGNSGGPLFDASTGVVYGVVTFKVGSHESNLAISIGNLIGFTRNAHVSLNLVDGQQVSVAGNTPSSAFPTSSPTPSWDVIACGNALSDFWTAFNSWNDSYNRYAESTGKTAGAGFMVGYEIKAINSVIKDEEPKVMNAEDEMEKSGAPIAKAVTEIVLHLRTADNYAQQWSYSRERVYLAIVAQQQPPPIDVDAFERTRSEMDAMNSAVSNLRYARCDRF